MLARTVSSENNAGKIGVLKPFDEAGRDLPIVLDDVEQNRAAVSDDHHLAALGRSLERSGRVETGLA